MRQRNSAGEGHHLSLLLKLSSLPISSHLQFLSSILKMSSVARAIRPFASRVLAQKPIAPICQASPAFRFPRGTRSFSQSPLCEYFAPPMLTNAARKTFEVIATGNGAFQCRTMLFGAL
jgi:hypothetical protein